MGGSPAPRSTLDAPALPQVPPGPSGAVQPLPLGRQARDPAHQRGAPRLNMAGVTTRHFKIETLPSRYLCQSPAGWQPHCLRRPIRTQTIVCVTHEAILVFPQGSAVTQPAHPLVTLPVVIVGSPDRDGSEHEAPS